MIRFFLIWLISLLLTGCKDQYLELEKDPLKGRINDKEWIFGSGRASSDQYLVQRLRGILLEENLNDPCTKVNSTEAHISLSVPYDRGNYNLPFPTNDFYVVFSVDGVTEYTANTGFIEIIAVTSTEVIGFLSADFDDGNNAQGSFSLRLCD